MPTYNNLDVFIGPQLTATDGVSVADGRYFDGANALKGTFIDLSNFSADRYNWSTNDGNVYDLDEQSIVATGEPSSPDATTGIYNVETDTLTQIESLYRYTDTEVNFSDGSTVILDMHVAILPDGQMLYYFRDEDKFGVQSLTAIQDKLDAGEKIESIQLGPTLEELHQQTVVNYDDDFGPVMQSFAVACFVSGTKILTKSGEVPIEDLNAGDLVKTKDHGFQKVVLVAKNAVSLSNTENADNLRPIRIGAGVLGQNQPMEELFVSPQHRILIQSIVVERMFEEKEILVAAKKLLQISGVDIVEDCDEVTYCHLLCDQHEIVYANGAETETLYTGKEAMKSVSAAARAEILAIFPEIAEREIEPTPARLMPSGRKVEKLVWRIQKNSHPLNQCETEA